MLPSRPGQDRSAAILAGGLLLLLLAWLVAAAVAAGQSSRPAQVAALPGASPTPARPGGSTPTPFQPAAVTPTATATASPTPPPTAEPPPLDYTRFGVDFSDTAQAISAVLSPSQDQFNAGRSLRISFRPGWPCAWINHRACTSLHYNGQVVLVTIHSGVAGDGQALRHALEGTWLNAAALPMQEIRANLAALQDGDVSIEQSGVTAQGLRALAAVRLPASDVEQYFSLSVDDALDFAAQSSAEMAQALASGEPLVIIETCGWRHPDEPWAPGITGTSASVYLITIGE